MIEQNEIRARHRHVEHVSREFEAWLARPDWTLDEAHDWLQGHFLPPVGHDEDIFVWILRGLLWADDRGAAEAETARRLARVLRERPDVTRPGLRSEELLYNLFMLCAGLGIPEVLGEPLLVVYDQRELRGRWMGTDLRVALTAALIPNQVDKRLLPVWLSMIDGGGGDDFLIGSLAHGLDGVTFLPADEPGEPPLEEIGKALKLVSQRMQDEPDRRPQLKGYIDRVISRYPGRPSWHEELIRLADECAWPDWAVVSLPSLCVPLDQHAPTSQCQILVWEVYLPLVAKLVSRLGSEFGFEPKPERGLCHDKVYQLSLPTEAADYLAPFTCVLEQRRQPRNTPLPSYSAVFGAVTDLMSEMELLPNANLQNWSKTFYPVLELMQNNEEVSDTAADVLAQARREVLPRNRAGVLRATAGESH